MTIDFGEIQFGIEEFIGLLIFGIAFLIHLVHQIMLIRFIFSDKQKNQQPNTPSVSIIITSRNYVDQLRDFLPTLLAQDYPDFEVVVVDDCSTDGTEWLLSEMKLRHRNLKSTRIIQETDFPNALAITIGVRAAANEWLIFLSPLCQVPDNQWLKNYAQRLTPDREVGIGYLYNSAFTGSFKSWIRFENFHSYLLSGTGKALGAAMPVFEYNIAYRREKFLDLRGFAAVLDSPFCENELFVNKIAKRKNCVIQVSAATAVSCGGEADWIDFVQFKKKQLMLRHKFRFGQRMFRTVNLVNKMLLNAALVVLLIFSPWKFWILGAWGFLLIFEMTWIAIAAKKTGEKNFLPMLLIYKAFLPVINSLIMVHQFFTGQKRKWK